VQVKVVKLVYTVDKGIERIEHLSSHVVILLLHLLILKRILISFIYLFF